MVRPRIVHARVSRGECGSLVESAREALLTMDRIEHGGKGVRWRGERLTARIEAPGLLLVQRSGSPARVDQAPLARHVSPIVARRPNRHQVAAVGAALAEDDPGAVG